MVSITVHERYCPVCLTNLKKGIDPDSAFLIAKNAGPRNEQEKFWWPDHIRYLQQKIGLAFIGRRNNLR